MSRTSHAYSAPDLSALAKNLKRELEARAQVPGHVELLNMLTRAVGYRNYQHFKASRAAEDRLANPPAIEAEPAVDFRRVELTARCFAGTDVLMRWPGKLNQQQLALWCSGLSCRRGGDRRKGGQRGAHAPQRLSRIMS